MPASYYASSGEFVEAGDGRRLSGPARAWHFSDIARCGRQVVHELRGASRGAVPSVV